MPLLSFRVLGEVVDAKRAQRVGGLALSGAERVGDQRRQLGRVGLGLAYLTARCLGGRLGYDINGWPRSDGGDSGTQVRAVRVVPVAALDVEVEVTRGLEGHVGRRCTGRCAVPVPSARCIAHHVPGLNDVHAVPIGDGADAFDEHQVLAAAVLRHGSRARAEVPQRGPPHKARAATITRRKVQHMEEGYTQLGTVLTDQRPEASEADGVIVVGRFKGGPYDGVQLSYDAGRRNLYLTPEAALRLAILLAAAAGRDIDIR